MNFHVANRGYHIGYVVRSSSVVLHFYGLVRLAAFLDWEVTQPQACSLGKYALESMLQPMRRAELYTK